MEVRELGGEDAEALWAHLSERPFENLFLGGLVEEHRPLRGGAPDAPCRLLGGFEGERLVAALFVGGDGGLLTPSAAEVPHLSAVVDAARSTVRTGCVVGPAEAVGVTQRRLGLRGLRILDERLFHVSADDLGPFTNPTLRLGTEADLEGLIPLAAGYAEERFGTHPATTDPDGLRLRVRERVVSRRTYVLEDAGTLVFKVDVGSRSRLGAELEAPYTLPNARRRGHATHSLGQLSRHLLSSLPRLAIRVDDRDATLARAVRKVGFLPARPTRILLSTGADPR